MQEMGCLSTGSGPHVVAINIDLRRAKRAIQFWKYPFKNPRSATMLLFGPDRPCHFLYSEKNEACYMHVNVQECVNCVFGHAASACSLLDLSSVAHNDKYLVVCIGKAFFFLTDQP